MSNFSIKTNPNRNDVARHAGVSVATVSYVINNGPRPVAPETRARVLQSIAELGYRPHAIARSLRTGSTRVIGLLVPSLISTFQAFLINAIEENLAEYDYSLIVSSSHEDCDREAHLLDMLASHSIDGLIYIPTACANQERIVELSQRGTPVVFVDRFHSPETFDVITSDNRDAAYQSTRYLISQGCKKILCLNFSEEASTAVERSQGFFQAITESGLEQSINTEMIVHYTLHETVSACMAAYVSHSGLPDGVLVCSELFFPETLSFLTAQDAQILAQVKIAGGFSSAAFQKNLYPPFPLVSQDTDQMAQLAIQRLMDRIQGNHPPVEFQRIPFIYPSEFRSAHFSAKESFS